MSQLPIPCLYHFLSSNSSLFGGNILSLHRIIFWQMKKAAFFLAVISLLVSGCGDIDLYLPSYGVNEVPESFFTEQPTDAAVVFPPAASMNMSPSASDAYRDITISTVLPAGNLVYAADINLPRVRTLDEGLTLSGSSSASIRFSAYMNDLVAAESFISGNATVSGTLPEGPVMVQISTARGVFHFKFDLITEISF